MPSRLEPAACIFTAAYARDWLRARFFSCRANAGFWTLLATRRTPGRSGTPGLALRRRRQPGQGGSRDCACGSGGSRGREQLHLVALFRFSVSSLARCSLLQPQHAAFPLFDRAPQPGACLTLANGFRRAFFWSTRCFLAALRRPVTATHSLPFLHPSLYACSLRPRPCVTVSLPSTTHSLDLTRMPSRLVALRGGIGSLCMPGLALRRRVSGPNATQAPGQSAAHVDPEA